MTQPIMIAYKSVINGPTSGACPGFLKGGGPLSFGSLKKGISFERGVQWSDRGSSTFVSLGRQILHI